MQINLLKKVVNDNAGAIAVKIVDLLLNKKDVNEFLIAKKLGLTINQTRNLLYRLSHLGIINSIRKKDKRKGWYIYFWTLNILKSLEVLMESLKSEIENLKLQLHNKKTKRFYKCKLCGREANEESALLTDFVCTECGEVYELADNRQIIEEISKNIAKLEREMQSVSSEIMEEKARLNKKVQAKNKKEDKKKKEIRDKLRKKKAKEKKKLNLKTKKKKPAKKQKKKREKHIKKKQKKTKKKKR